MKFLAQQPAPVTTVVPSKPKRSKKIAIVIIVLIVAAATILALKLTERQETEIRIGKEVNANVVNLEAKQWSADAVLTYVAVFSKPIRGPLATMTEFLWFSFYSNTKKDCKWFKWQPLIAETVVEGANITELESLQEDFKVPPCVTEPIVNWNSYLLEDAGPKAEDKLKNNFTQIEIVTTDVAAAKTFKTIGGVPRLGIKFPSTSKIFTLLDEKPLAQMVFTSNERWPIIVFVDLQTGELWIAAGIFVSS